MPISLGVARGKISIDTSDVSKARVSIEQESRKISTSLKSAGEGGDFNKFFADSTAALKKTSAEAQKTGITIKKSFKDSGDAADNLAKSLNKVGREFAPISIGAGLISAQGFKAATSVEQINIKFKSLAGSQAKADVLMGKIATRAKELDLPVKATQDAFAGLIPFIGQSQEAIDKYVGISARLLTVNPLATQQDALFSLREAISSGGTDLISLAERFNLPKKRLRELVEQTGDFGEALNIVLNEMGATEASAKEIGGSIGGIVTRLLDAANRLLAAGFGPLFKSLAPLLEQAADAVEKLAEQNPGILQIAAGFTLILGAVTPVLLAVGNLVSLFSTLSKLDIAGKVVGGLGNLKGAAGGLAKDFVTGKGAGRAVGVGLAVTGGVQLGAAGARFLAERGIGDTSLANVSQEEALNKLGDRLKQGGVVLVGWLFDLFGALYKVGAKLRESFENIGRVIEVGGTFLREAFGQVETALGKFIQAIGQLIEKIPGQEAFGTQVRQAGIAAINAGGRNQFEAQGRRQQLVAELRPEAIESRFAAIDKTYDAEIKKAKDNFLGGLFKFLFPDDSEQKLQDASEAFGVSLADAVKGIFDKGKQILDSALKATSFNEDQIKAFETYRDDRQQIIDKANEDELAAREAHVDKLKKIDEDADADIEAIHERAKERAAEDEQAIVDKRSEIAASAKERVAADEAELQDKRLEVAAKVAEQIAEEETSYQTSRQKIVADAQKADLQLTKQYNDDLLSLIRDRREAESNLDARAVGRLNDRKDELGTKLGDDRAANKQQTEERLAEADREHLARIAQIQAAGDKEIQQFAAQQAKKEQAQVAADGKEIEKLIAQQQKRQQAQDAADAVAIAKINANREQEKALEGQAYTQRLNQIIDQKNRELQLRENKFRLEFDQLAGHENAKLGIARAYQAATEAELRAWWERQRAVIASQAPVVPRSTTPVPRQRPGVGYGGGFALGSPLIPQDMVANIHRGEGIMSAPVAAMARSMLGNNYAQPQLGALLAGRQQGAAGSLVLNWSGDVPIYDAGNRSDAEIKGLVEEGLTDGFLRLHAQLTGGKS